MINLVDKTRETIRQEQRLLNNAGRYKAHCKSS